MTDDERKAALEENNLPVELFHEVIQANQNSYDNETNHILLKMLTRILKSAGLKFFLHF